MLEPIDRLRLTGGIRHDWNKAWGDHFNYRVAAVYSFLFGLSLKAMYGTSYVPPAPAQLETSPLRFEGGIVGNPELKSQKASTAELAVEYKHKEWFDIGPAWIVFGSLGVTLPKYFFQASMTVNYIGERKSSAANLIYNGEAYLLSRYATVDMTLRTLGFKPILDRTTTISVHANNIFDQ